MRRLLLLCTLVLFPPAATASAQAPVALPQAPAAPAAPRTSRVEVRVPSADAVLTVNGKAVEGTGTTRTFETPPLDRGKPYDYTFSVEWNPNTYTTMTRSKTLTFVAGEPAALDLTIADLNDRVRVIYVPTPDDVAREMVRLAGVTSDDVIFEPGCGDARITIAAVASGARRGMCVDIQEERVKDSRAKVAEAGLADRIDVQLGDALEFPELSKATVVFLYMGDHFNLLFRPRLWQALPVGARIVSHRFRMGDWEPDRTVFVSSAEGGEYELHLWTVTEALKRSGF